MKYLFIYFNKSFAELPKLMHSRFSSPHLNKPVVKVIHWVFFFLLLSISHSLSCPNLYTQGLAPLIWTYQLWKSEWCFFLKFYFNKSSTELPKLIHSRFSSPHLNIPVVKVIHGVFCFVLFFVFNFNKSFTELPKLIHSRFSSPHLTKPAVEVIHWVAKEGKNKVY